MVFDHVNILASNALIGLVGNGVPPPLLVFSVSLASNALIGLVGNSVGEGFHPAAIYNSLPMR